MILLRSIIFLALTLGAVWYFLANPDRQAETAKIEQALHFEAELRDEALTTILEKFQLAAVMIARSPQATALVAPKQEPVTTSGFSTAVVADDAMSDEDALEDLQALESLTGLDAIRILRKGETDTLPALAPPSELVVDGSWDAGVSAAFQGRLGRASYTDEDGNPVYVFFTPYFAEDSIPAIIISDALLRGEKSRWESSQYLIAVTDSTGKVILENSSKLDGEIIKVGHDMPTLNATITAAASKPPLFGQWIIRSAAVVLIAILGLFLWEQQRARRRVVSELAEARHFKAMKLEEEVVERTAELGEVKDQLAVSESLAMVGQVSASIGQEINQPLSAIKNYAEAASRFIDKGNAELAQQNIRNMSKLTDRISRIVGNLRGFVSSEPYQIEPVSVRPVVHDSAVGMLDRFPALGDYFFMEIADDVPDAAFVRADKVRLGQVIGNLLSSSWDACRDEDQPELVISIQQSENDFVVAIDHNGQSKATTGSTSSRVNVGEAAGETSTSGGPGVGFTIAKSFVEGMGGELEYKSSALGGARTEIILPKFRSGTT
jgi:C4-dicarboxylate-specific signal transduction histidine kinase